MSRQPQRGLASRAGSHPAARWLAAVALVLALCAVPGAHAAIVGWHDRTDWSALQGWACDDDGDPAPVTVYFFATLDGRFTQIGNATADRYRADIARSNICAGAYHGFVFADLPLALVDGSTHAIYAYAEGPQRRLLPLHGTPQPLETRPRGLWDPGLANGRWRTDYASDQAGTAAAPLLLDHDAHGRCFLWRSPPYLMAGASFDAYAGDAAECFTAPETFARSNAASSEPVRTADDFWIVTVNVEKAYDAASACVSGPPNQSVPLHAPGQGLASLVTLDAAGAPTPRKRAHLILNTYYDNCGKIPFLSFGAQSGFGNGGTAPIALLRGAEAPVLRFDATLVELAPDEGLQNAAYVFVEAIWGGRKRWAYLYLLARGLGEPLDRQHFNWNIRDSVWFPGADIVYRDVATLDAECGRTPGWLPLRRMLALGVRRSYAIDLESLFECLGPSRFSEPLPSTGPVPITGIHFAIEQGPARGNWTHLAVDGVELAAR